MEAGQRAAVGGGGNEEEAEMGTGRWSQRGDNSDTRKGRRKERWNGQITPRQHLISKGIIFHSFRITFLISFPLTRVNQTPLKITLLCS